MVLPCSCHEARSDVRNSAFGPRRRGESDGIVRCMSRSAAGLPRSRVRGVFTSLVLLVGLVAAALVPTLRPVLLVVLGVVVVLAPRGSAPRWAAAACLPVALILLWGAVAGNQARSDLADCANLISPPAVVRVAEAIVVCGLIALLARWLGVGVVSLGLPRPSRHEVALGAVAVVLIPLGSLLLGGWLAEPFFGPVRLQLADPLAIVPALALAVANGMMEELAYRGALMAWLSRASVPLLALVGQAVVFGAAHSGGDFVGDAWPVMLAVGAGGLLAGIVVRRTGSLWLPIVVHIGFDVPLYYAAVCRLPA
jgi:membrane protease YdiL (CAAX protease family)